MLIHAMQGRAARRRDGQNAARRASHGTASTSGVSYSSSAAPVSAPRQNHKQTHAAGRAVQSGVVSRSKGCALSDLVPITDITPAIQGIKQHQQSPLSTKEAHIAEVLLESQPFKGTATSDSKPQTGYMHRYGQQLMLSQRVENELKSGAEQTQSFADEMMPDSPEELQRHYDVQQPVSAALEESRQAATAGISVRQPAQFLAGAAAVHTSAPRRSARDVVCFASPSSSAWDTPQVSSFAPAQRLPCCQLLACVHPKFCLTDKSKDPFT